MSIFSRKNRQQEHSKTRRKRENLTDFALYQVASTGQRSAVGDRSEMAAGAMNNNQKLATLNLLRELKD